MFHEQNRNALRVDLPDDLENPRDDLRREAERRLVEHQQLRFAHQRAADGKHLLLAAGERSAELLAALHQQRKIMEDFLELGRVALRRMEQAAADKILVHGQPRKDVAAFRAEANAAAQHVVRARGKRRAVPRDGAAAHGHDARDGEQRGALARSVGAEQRDDFARPDLESNLLENLDRTVTGVDLGKSEHGDAVLPGALLALVAEVGLDHRGILPHLFRRAVRDGHAVVEDENFVGDRHHHFHVMLDQKHGEPAIANASDQANHVQRLLRVHARRGLVEKQQPRFRGQRAGDLEPPLLAVGEAGGNGIGAVGEPDEIEAGERLRALLVLLRAELPRAKKQRQRRERTMLELRDEHILQHGHLRKQPDVLESARQPEPANAMRRAPGNLAPVDPDRAAIGTVDAAEAIEEGGLARAVRADDADDAVRADAEIDLLHGLQPAEGLAQVARFQQRGHRFRISVFRLALPSRPWGR